MFNGSDKFLITAGLSSNLQIPCICIGMGLLTLGLLSLHCLFAVPMSVPPILLNPNCNCLWSSASIAVSSVIVLTVSINPLHVTWFFSEPSFSSTCAFLCFTGLLISFISTISISSSVSVLALSLSIDPMFSVGESDPNCFPLPPSFLKNGCTVTHVPAQALFLPLLHF